MNSKEIPFLKWPGGKRWFVHNHSDLLPRKFDRYIEPFLGGGSVFFYFKPQNALIGDTNPELITAYRGIKEDWEEIVKLLQIHQQNHSERYYYCFDPIRT